MPREEKEWKLTGYWVSPFPLMNFWTHLLLFWLNCRIPGHSKTLLETVAMQLHGYEDAAYLATPKCSLKHWLHGYAATKTAFQAHFFKKSPFGDPRLYNGRHKKIQPAKETVGKDTSWNITQRANAMNSIFSTLHFATSSLCIYVEFRNNERGKEKDGWYRRLYYWLYSSYYW